MPEVTRGRLVHLHDGQPCLTEPCLRPCDREDPQDSLSPLKLVRVTDPTKAECLDRFWEMAAQIHARRMLRRLAAEKAEAAERSRLTD